MKRAHVKQRPDRRMCGHCSVAIAAEVPIRDVVEVIGHRRGTTTRELAAALRHFGFDADSRLKPWPKGAKPELAIVKIASPRGGNWHWVVFADGMWYDPENSRPRRTPPSKGKVSSYIGVRTSRSH